MDPDTAILQTEDDMEKAVEYLLHEFATVRTGKASPGLIENMDVYVHSYGGTQKLKSLAFISAPEARLLEVKVFDPSTTQDIERALRESRLGLNPAAAGSSLRIPIPELSEERRVQMVKLVKQLSEEAKVRIRSIRKDGMDMAKKLKADNLLTEDGQKDHEAQVQKLTDKFIKVVDEHVVTKEKEVMKV